MVVFGDRANRSTRRKPLGAEKRTNKLNPHMPPDLGIALGPHWWEASVLTTAPSMYPLSCSFMPLSRYIAVIPGAIESISAVEGKGWLFHSVLVIEWTGVALCASFVMCRSVHVKTSFRLICRKIPIFHNCNYIVPPLCFTQWLKYTLCNDFHHAWAKIHPWPYHHLTVLRVLFLHALTTLYSFIQLSYLEQSTQFQLWKVKAEFSMEFFW